ncbi:hypothetical protein SMACR_06777 [Sordaria macrospora]|uniref:Chromatin modification-related protein EAF3 n=1 Tax=Sordaria macrospora TaxID=5147 RepID=A0A8S8ZQK5_SORMA|nr:hypothetical protein SMACR_06777 [Sordaria macrospora]WPJ64969.1 hypothetical protein SMAC4_06777 [Sordaria macrospora]
MSRSMRSHGQDVDNTKTRSSSSSISSFAACEARWSKLAEPADRLIRLPSKLTSTYVDRYGRTTFDDTYALGWTSTRPPPIGANHPKIIRARNNGNWSEKLEAYYSELPPNYNIPLAGQACKKPDEDWSSRSPTRVATPHGTDFGPFTVLLDALAKIRKPREPTAGQKMWECQFAPKEMRKEKEDNFHNRPSIKLPLPDHVKALLVDDWENVTKNQQLVPIPHVHPVDEILKDYLEHERPHRLPETPQMDILEETVAGLREYFDRCLGRILLYRFERAQYHEQHNIWTAGTDEKHKSASDTYGAEHLARLLVSLPELVAQTNMDQQSVNRLREELIKFTSWFSRHTTKYFVSEYETPSQEYVEQARSV